MIRIAFGCLLLLLGFAAPASAANWWLRDKMPACNDRYVLSVITNRFDWAERRTWHTRLTINEIKDIRETAIRLPGKSTIDRRYCSAVAWLSNGTESEVVYVIAAGQGFASIGSRITWCLPAYDRYYVYAPWCKAIRPAHVP